MPEISIKPEVVFHIGQLPITNSMFMGTLTAIVLLIFGLLLKRSLSEVPGKLQGWFEVIMEETLKIMDNVLGSRERSLQYFPIVFTIFLFVLVSNWMGLLPLSHVLVGEAPLFRAATSDLNFTIALAVMSVLAVNVLGAAAIGVSAHLNKFFVNPLRDPIGSFVGLLELVSEFVKIISFSFRLFGNVFAGEVLLTIVAFLVPYAVPLPFLFLEVFVGVIQAFIFAMLTLVFLGMSIVTHGEHSNEPLVHA
ncbi:ATP synthase F0 subunit A [Candidatus Kaiserbacteria bacterium CG10_big_fil_rev_8_21_14_0_10_56_12]|uniref:ATP synthase subunit a n=1 Tax=Candidatus Kaiserbacteria bacterium CG10_big_fil_rev_8_21_14_0_10_56_12 TaxID=1974611 RepID=A0A2H0UAA3_9BACT|nr:MAG: ATP synthase F0 subunit A [Candidatus Kaiserbacteria bacterium CG10_big_fil_rev_8_21_14_0_10_56_12]